MIIVWAKTGVAWMERSLRSVIQVLLAERMIMASQAMIIVWAIAAVAWMERSLRSAIQVPPGRNDDQGQKSDPFYPKKELTSFLYFFQ